MLVEKFAGTPDDKPQGWGWNNQRWIRFRTATAGLDAWLKKFQANYNLAVPGALPYPALVGPDAEAPLPSYGLPKDDRGRLNDLTAGLLTLAATWGPDNVLSDHAPRPRPRLRLVPDDRAASNVAEYAAETPTQDQDPQM